MSTADLPNSGRGSVVIAATFSASGAATGATAPGASAVPSAPGAPFNRTLLPGATSPAPAATAVASAANDSAVDAAISFRTASSVPTSSAPHSPALQRSSK